MSIWHHAVTWRGVVGGSACLNGGGLLNTTAVWAIACLGLGHSRKVACRQASGTNQRPIFHVMGSRRAAPLDGYMREVLVQRRPGSSGEKKEMRHLAIIDNGRGSWWGGSRLKKNEAPRRSCVIVRYGGGVRWKFGGGGGGWVGWFYQTCEATDGK